jgi:hypothetical protein
MLWAGWRAEELTDYHDAAIMRAGPADESGNAVVRPWAGHAQRIDELHQPGVKWKRQPGLDGDCIGRLGFVASRLVERLSKPVFLFTWKETAHGSVAASKDFICLRAGSPAEGTFRIGNMRPLPNHPNVGPSLKSL